jgi:hypothetical protein
MRGAFSAVTVQFSAAVKRLATAMIRAAQLGHPRIRVEQLLIALSEALSPNRRLRYAGVIRNALIESATQAAAAGDGPCVEPTHETAPERGPPTCHSAGEADRSLGRDRYDDLGK